MRAEVSAPAVRQIRARVGHAGARQRRAFRRPPHHRHQNQRIFVLPALTQRSCLPPIPPEGFQLLVIYAKPLFDHLRVFQRPRLAQLFQDQVTTPLHARHRLPQRPKPLVRRRVRTTRLAPSSLVFPRVPRRRRAALETRVLHVAASVDRGWAVAHRRSAVPFRSRRQPFTRMHIARQRSSRKGPTRPFAGPTPHVGGVRLTFNDTAASISRMRQKYIPVRN